MGPGVTHHPEQIKWLPTLRRGCRTLSLQPDLKIRVSLSPSPRPFLLPRHPFPCSVSMSLHLSLSLILSRSLSLMCTHLKHMFHTAELALFSGALTRIFCFVKMKNEARLTKLKYSAISILCKDTKNGS